jgi:hypothetical protein
MSLFKKHYTLDQARALLPKIRGWFAQLEVATRELEQLEQRLASMAKEGDDLGGDTVNRWGKALANVRATLFEFERRHIQVKDVERGLIDFPALRDGKEIFLCWEKDEDDIEHWHDLDSGYAGREPL